MFEQLPCKKEPKSSLKNELAEIGVKVFLEAMGDLAETGFENFELDQSSIVLRWKEIFGEAIKKNNISEADLQKYAEEFSEEALKIKNWVKSQSNPEQYEILHSINPFSNEHIRIIGRVNRIYGVTMRFDGLSGEKPCIEKDSQFF